MLTAVVGGGVTACGGGEEEGSLRSPVTGVVVEVTGQGIDSVESFRLRVGGGAVHTFRLDLESNEFQPSHLRAHQADLTPVRVHFKRQGADLVATKLEDAELLP